MYEALYLFLATGVVSMSAALSAGALNKLPEDKRPSFMSSRNGLVAVIMAGNLGALTLIGALAYGVRNLDWWIPVSCLFITFPLVHVALFQRLLPRLLEIIYEINARFLRQVSLKWPGDIDRLQRMSIIEESGERHVRMAWLAIVGSFSVNGVAALHSQLLRDGLFHDFYQLWPEKFNNKTNGVTPRRWVAYANPGMSALISETIGDDWVADLSQLEQLKPYAGPNHEAFHARWRQIKLANKQRLAALVKAECDVDFEPTALFDVQVKRIHEYKRQLLNVLHVIHLYLRIKNGHMDHWTNRCVLIGGKAAPGYVMAKRIIKLINNVAEVINNDPTVGDRLKLVFFPNYGVSSMEIIAP